MSSEIENQIVSMQFDNKQFESGVNTSMSTLDKLKNSLNFTSRSNGLNDLQIASSKLDLSNADKQVSTITHHLNLLKTAGLVAFGTIVRQATYMGEHIAASFTIDPIKAGFQNYEKQINATKTILSNTAASGTKLKDVESTLKNLNNYANLTVYNFADMAKNIGTFTAAGVALKPATESIKGIANLAALSGSSSEQASSAMYQLSQAIAAGQVHLQDWNSVVNAGIGGTVFQRALAQTAVQMGTLDKSSVKLTGSMKNVSINGAAFRQSLTPPPGGTAWLTSKVLTSTLAQFTGDLSAGKLAAEGYSKAQIKAIQNQAKMAVQAATQIRTFSQLTQALKEEVASAWANVFKAIFGNINDATTFFTGLHNVLQNFLTAPINQLAKFLEQFRKAQGFIAVWDSFKNIFKAIGNILYPITFLFHALGKTSGDTAKGAAGMAKAFEKFTEWLVKVTSATHKMYLPLRQVATILKTLGGYVVDAVGQLKKFSFLGDVIANAFKPIEKQMNDVGYNIIHGLYNGIVGNSKEIKYSIENLGNNIIEWIKNVLGIHSPATTMIPIGINILQGIVSGLSKGSQYLIKGLQKVFIGIGKTLKYMSQNISWSDVLDTINTGLFVGIVLLFRQFVKAFSGTLGQFRALMGKAGGTLDQITSNLKTMQSKVKSEIIRNIAISVALLAGSALLLSTIDAKKLGLAIGAIAGLMTSLVASMAVITHGAGKGSVKDSIKQMTALSSVSKALVAFSSAVLILTAAVALMGQLKPKTIEKGLAGVAGVISIIVAATAILSKTGGGATILATATAMLIMSASLTAFVGVMKLYEKLDWKTLVRGGGAAAGVILAVGLAMRGFGKGSIGGATGLIIASAALVILAKAMQMLAKIGLGDMIKSVLALNWVLADLALAAAAMSAAEGGAASMLVMSAAIIVLAKALQIISKIGLGDLVKSVLAISGAMIILGGTASALSALSPLVSAFGLALLLVGGAIFLAGTGVLAFATAMGILAVVGPAAFQALQQGIDDFIKDLPKIAHAFGEAVVSFFTGIVDAAGPLLKAIGKLINILIDALTNAIPHLKKLAQKLINAILDVVANSYKHAAHVMLQFVIHLLDQLANGVPKMITAGTNLIIGVIEGLGKNSARVANALARAILRFLRSIDKTITTYEPQIIHEGVLIAWHMGEGLAQGLLGSHVMKLVKDAAVSLAHKLPGWMQKVLGIKSPSTVMRDEVGKWIPLGVAGGIDDHAGAVKTSAEDMANQAFDTLRQTFANSKKSVNGLVDLKPKITPVLDLSQLEKDSVKMGNVFGNPKLTADVSRRGARDIASKEAAKGYGGHEPAGDTYNFYQTNNSPKPINAAKAYRGTKSQIALLKGVKGG